MIVRKKVREGIFGGVEYVGEVIENKGVFTGMIKEVTAEEDPVTDEAGFQDTKTFDNFNAASHYVVCEWEAKFGAKAPE
ncbi:hypothetical protein [Paenibacillus xerothermodurans]|uniref:Uncharacterized protein n=1 Tax=Paenibacillus xerothermodurans TaxID=1977292 RepID=A0A2W1NZC8_PAEXE|nr:hypothetical protein [Paenibacillus xerothermodurans]PZE20208.1 hypothetical protein CBW46_013735 [Paenibacillus xerothermodurans]